MFGSAILDLILIIAIVGAAVYAAKKGWFPDIETEQRGKTRPFSDIKDEAQLLLYGYDLQHLESWKKNQSQQVVVSFRCDQNGVEAKRFHELEKGIYKEAAAIRIGQNTRIEVRSRIFPRLKLVYGGAPQRDDINGAHIVAVQETGHIQSLLCFAASNADEPAANAAADLRLWLAKQWESNGDAPALPNAETSSPSPASTARPAADGFDL